MCKLYVNGKTEIEFTFSELKETEKGKNYLILGNVGKDGYVICRVLDPLEAVYTKTHHYILLNDDPAKYTVQIICETESLEKAEEELHERMNH